MHAPGLLVVETKSVHELVLDDALSHASFHDSSGQVDLLRAPMLATDVGAIQENFPRWRVRES